MLALRHASRKPPYHIDNGIMLRPGTSTRHTIGKNGDMMPIEQKNKMLTPKKRVNLCPVFFCIRSRSMK